MDLYSKGDAALLMEASVHQAELFIWTERVSSILGRQHALTPPTVTDAAAQTIKGRRPAGAALWVACC